MEISKQRKVSGKEQDNVKQENGTNRLLTKKKSYCIYSTKCTLYVQALLGLNLSYDNNLSES